MLLARGRYWNAALGKKRTSVVLTLGRDGLPDELSEVKDLRIEVPLGRWSSVVKHAHGDRKLLGGILLRHSSPEELVARVVGSDRLLGELQRMVRDATVALVEAEVLVLEPPSAEEDS